MVISDGNKVTNQDTNIPQKTKSLTNVHFYKLGFYLRICYLSRFASFILSVMQTNNSFI